MRRVDRELCGMVKEMVSVHQMNPKGNMSKNDMEVVFTEIVTKMVD